MAISARSKRGGAKSYILDTSVLIHDPESIYSFEENNVYIPGEVLEELDKFKTEQTDRGRNARKAHRVLNKIFPSERFMTSGFQKEEGGEIKLLFNAYLNRDIKKCEQWERLKSLFHDFGKTDNRILACAVYIAVTTPTAVTMVSKDINMQLKARLLGIESQDYLTDKVKDDEVFAADYKKVSVSVYDMQKFASSGEFMVNADVVEKIYPGSYLLVEDEQQKTIPAKHIGDGLLRRIQGNRSIAVRGAAHIQARNLGQQFLIDALFDPQVQLVTVYGKAGTGKTFLGIAAGLQQIYEGKFTKLLVTRAIVPMGRDIGFLPGTKEEKMKPWVQPIYDNIESIMRPLKEPAFQGKPHSARKEDDEHNQHNNHGQHPMKPHERLMAAGLLEVEALPHIRGRSIPGVFFIVDEAQQLSPHETKTIVTRMGEGAKLVMIGDLAQIDNPYVDAYSNGLVYARNCFKGQSLAAHVNLIKGERSELSELGANLM
ncbi:MAG: PhoH family protein [Verrucomicrobiota bacterium]